MKRKCVHDAFLHYGGPVDGPLIAVHDSATLGGSKFAETLWVTSDQDILKRLFIEKGCDSSFSMGWRVGAWAVRDELEFR